MALPNKVPRPEVQMAEFLVWQEEKNAARAARKAQLKTGKAFPSGRTYADVAEQNNHLGSHARPWGY